MDQNLSNLSESAPVVRLEDIAKGEAADLPILKHRLQREVAGRILRLFTISTVAMILLVLVLAGFDLFFIRYDIIEPSERLITQSVVMSVIGATIVQVGAAAFAITQSVFKAEKADQAIAQEL